MARYSLRNPNHLYYSYGHSPLKAKALRLGYPFKITQKELLDVPFECHCGNLNLLDGVFMILDTLEPGEGFIAGNCVWHCRRHLGERNEGFKCSNMVQLDW